MRPIFLLCALVALLPFAGCAHRARTFAPPDHQRLTESTQRLHAAVTKAKVLSAEVKVAHAAEVGTTTRMTTQLAELRRVAPPELMPRIDGMEAELTALKNQHDTTSAKVQLLDATIEEAQVAKVDQARYGPEYIAATEAQTGKLNEAEQAWHKDSAEIVSLRMGSIFTKILAGLGILLFVVVAAGAGFLWWTGRMAKTAAVIAGKTVLLLFLFASLLISGCSARDSRDPGYGSTEHAVWMREHVYHWTPPPNEAFFSTTLPKRYWVVDRRGVYPPGMKQPKVVQELEAGDYHMVVIEVEEDRFSNPPTQPPP